MRGNPFDESLSPEARRRLQQVRALREVPGGTDELCAYLHRNRSRIRTEWQRDREDQHYRILDQALEREEVEADVAPLPEPSQKAQEEAEDDRVFAHIKDRDHLLEFRDDRLYLRGHRALERREAYRLQQQKQAQAPEPEETPESAPLNGVRIWAILSGVCVGLIWLYTLTQSFWGGLFAGLPLFFAWLLFFRLPLTYIGTFSGSGSSRGASGNYV